LIGFIVPDNEVEESGEDEESKSGGKKERRHKKHKIKQLDEEDFDLI
jgi:hypothetical protein